MDVVADEVNIVDDIDKKMKIKRMTVLLETALTEREREIIRLRYGLDGHDELTQKTVANILGISRSYVSRIEKSALLKLRRML
jgi:RNA polymerase sporulation-specific sigma factor